MDELCDQARAWRGRLGLTPQAAALRLGITVAYYNRFEAGVNDLGAEVAARLRHELGSPATPNPAERRAEERARNLARIRAATEGRLEALRQARERRNAAHQNFMKGKTA